MGNGLGNISAVHRNTPTPRKKEYTEAASIVRNFKQNTRAFGESAKEKFLGVGLKEGAWVVSPQ